MLKYDAEDSLKLLVVLGRVNSFFCDASIVRGGRVLTDVEGLWGLFGRNAKASLYHGPPTEIS
jgi:hypothetical protein